MTARELIQELEKVNGDFEVACLCPGYDMFVNRVTVARGATVLGYPEEYVLLVISATPAQET